MKTLRITLVYALLVLIAATTVVPLVWMGLTSLHGPRASIPTMSTLFNPDKGSFVGWSGDVTGDAGTITVVMDRDRDISARFAKKGDDKNGVRIPEESPTEEVEASTKAEYALRVTTQGLGTVEVSPESESGGYPAGTTVELTAVPDPGWHPENYWTVLTYGELPIWRFAINSFVVTGGVVFFQLALCSLAAFGFSRLHWRGRDPLFFVFLLTMMVPAQVLVVPLFMVVQKLGWLDTYWGLIIPYPYLSTAFGTFLLRQFFVTLPKSLDEAARLDGCGEFGLFWRIILPSAKPAVATVAAFAFIWTWTDFYWPLLASSSTTMRTLEVGLSVFKDSYGGMQWSLQMAAAVIVLIPVLIVFLSLQRFFVRGVVMSGMKG